MPDRWPPKAKILMGPELEVKLEEKSIKPTTMRLLKKLVDSNVAISLNDLESKFDRADKATLYRTLKTFEKKKLDLSLLVRGGACTCVCT